jgi:hypothetical protein
MKLLLGAKIWHKVYSQEVQETHLIHIFAHCCFAYLQKNYCDNICAPQCRSLALLWLLLCRRMEQASTDYQCSEERPPEGGWLNHFFEVDQFIKRFLKFKLNMEAVMAPYSDAYKDMQKAKQAKITSFFTKSSVFSSVLHSVLFDHPHKFQSGTPTSSQ